MLAYVQTLLNVGLRKKGPEDLPDSGFLLGLTFAVYLLLQIVLVWAVLAGSSRLTLSILIEILMIVVGLRVLLTLSGYKSRFRQSLTAIFGTEGLLTVLQIPVNYWHVAALTKATGVALPGTIIFAIEIWRVMIEGHIISRAISKPFGIGLMIAVAFFFLKFAVLIELMRDTPVI